MSLSCQAVDIRGLPPLEKYMKLLVGIALSLFLGSAAMAQTSLESEGFPFSSRIIFPARANE